MFSLYLLLKEAEKSKKSSLVFQLDSLSFEFIFSYKNQVVFINTPTSRFQCSLKDDTLCPLEQKKDLKKLQLFFKLLRPSDMPMLFTKHKRRITLNEIAIIQQQTFIENLLELRSHYQDLYLLFENPSYQRKATRILSYLRFLEKRNENLFPKKI